MTDERRRELEAAYRTTSYFVDGPGGRFAIRIGRVSPEADALAAGGDWLYVTAHNPGSVTAPPEQNAERQRELERVLAAAGYRFYGGEGRGDDGSHPPEASVLAAGVDEATAAELGRRFGQAAVVVGGGGGPARLIWVE